MDAIDQEETVQAVTDSAGEADPSIDASTPPRTITQPETVGTPDVPAGPPTLEHVDSQETYPTIRSGVETTIGTAGEQRFKAGQVVGGRYHIEGCIGKGGMGTVYRVRDILQPHRATALKILHADAISPQRVNQFKAEFRILTKLAHPNLSIVYDFGSLDDENHFFTLEYVDGADLYEATTAMDWQQSLDYVVQICRALSFIHSRDIVHFDLKPGNILVGSDGTAKLVDFGVAEAREGRSGSGMRGTPVYMAPEMCMFGGEVDHRADLYALGITAYQLIYRKPPFRGRTVHEILGKHRQQALEFDNSVDVPVWVRTLITKLCAKEPAHRYPSANAVIKEINRYSDCTYEVETEETAHSYILSSQFIGREHELEQLTSFVNARLMGKTGGPRGIFILGEGGTGKSRLIREVRYHAQLSRIPFVDGNCYQTAGSDYAPLAEIIRHLVGSAEALGRGDLIESFGAELAKIEPSVAEERELKASVPLENVAAEQERVLSQTAKFFVAVAEALPYVLYFNDLHWAAPGIIKFLRILFSEISQRPPAVPVRLALLGSLRPSDSSPALNESFLKSPEYRDMLATVELEPLNASHIESLACSMLGVEELPTKFRNRLHEASRGNPFFVEEVMRHLVEQGAAKAEQGLKASAQNSAAASLPSSVYEVFQRRMTSLDQGAQDVVVMLAVYGQPVDATLLQTFLSCDAANLSQTLGKLSRRQIIRTVGRQGGLYRLAHDRMSEAAYHFLEDKERRALHARIVRVLEQQSNQRQSDVVHMLAHHAWHAGLDVESIQYCFAAGTNAQNAFSNDLAVLNYERALRLLQKELSSKPMLLLEIHEKLADVKLITGETQQSLDNYANALKYATVAVDRARLHRKRGQVFGRLGDRHGEVKEYSKAIQHAGGSTVRPEGAFQSLVELTKIPLGWALYGRKPQRLAARASGEQSMTKELGGAYTQLGLATTIRCDLDAQRYIYLGFRNAAQSGDDVALCEALLARAKLLAYQTRYRQAEDVVLNALHAAERASSRMHVALARTWQAKLAVLTTRWRDAVDSGKQAADALSDCGEVYTLGEIAAYVALAQMHLGAVPRAVGWASTALELLNRAGHSPLTMMAYEACAHVYIVAGEFGAVNTILQKLEAYRSIENIEFPHLAFHTVRGRWAAAKGEHAGAVKDFSQVVEVWLPYLNGMPGPYVAGAQASLSRASAYLAKQSGKDVQLKAQKELKQLKKANRFAFSASHEVDPRRRHPEAGVEDEGGIRRSRTFPLAEGETQLAKTGWLYLTGRTKAARAAFDRVVKNAERSGDVLSQARALTDAGFFLRGDDNSEADAYLRRAASLFEHMGANAYLHQVEDQLCIAGAR